VINNQERIFAFDQQTLISIAIQLFNACVLAFVLALVLYKPVRKFLNTRNENIKGQFADAQKQIEEAQTSKELYESKIQELEKEKTSLIEAAQRTAAEKSKQMIVATKKECAELKEQTMIEIQAQREKSEEEVRLHIIETATIMAEKFIAVSIDKKTQNKLFEETIAQLKDMPWKN